MDIYEEFSNLSNKEAYEHAFTHRFLLKSTDDPSEFLGNTQRKNFLPYLQTELCSLPENCQILDVGAGAGEIVDIALHNLGGATINLEEPNEFLLNQYVNRISRYPHLHLGHLFPMTIQALSQIPEAYQKLKKGSQDLILSIHMVYHLTDCSAEVIHPEQDLIKMLSFLYNLLKLGSSIFLVYSNGERATIEKVTIMYYKKFHPEYASRLKTVYQSLNQLLINKAISPILEQLDPKFKPRIQVVTQESFMYGHTIEDVGAMCLIGEILPVNNEKFDLNLLHFCIDFIKQNTQALGLIKEERAILQNGMYRCYQPQVICIISKTS